MANLIFTSADLTEPILIAEERQTSRRCFRVLDPRHVCVVDIDDVGEAAALDLLDDFASTHASRWRAYRTHSGLRYIELSEIWTPRTHVIEELMLSLGADPQYVSSFVLSFTVGREKGTFSARIDPKPWNMINGPSQSELMAMSQEDFDTYKAVWDVQKLSYRVAEFLGEYGNNGLPIHPWAQLVINYHDAETRSAASLPLA